MSGGRSYWGRHWRLWICANRMGCVEEATQNLKSSVGMGSGEAKGKASEVRPIFSEPHGYSQCSPPWWPHSLTFPSSPFFPYWPSQTTSPILLLLLIHPSSIPHPQLPPHLLTVISSTDDRRSKRQSLRISRTSKGYSI